MAGGLIDDISVVLVYYAIIHQLYYLIDPYNIFKRCRICCMFKVTHKDGETYLPNFTQIEAEQLFEGPELDITYHVIDTLFVFWVAMFYLPLLPVGILSPLFAFATNIAYLKYKLLTTHK